jgi:hypothetical protein
VAKYLLVLISLGIFLWISRYDSLHTSFAFSHSRIHWRRRRNLHILCRCKLGDYLMVGLYDREELRLCNIHWSVVVHSFLSMHFRQKLIILPATGPLGDY